MAYDARIILAGQPVDAIGSLQRGTQAAAQTNALRTQNDLTRLFQTQGAGILAGDQGALNALAGIDPMVAMGMKQQTRQFEIMNAQERRAIAEAARQMDDRQKAAALEQTKREVFRFLSAPDAATFDMMVTQAGKPELAGMYDRRQVLAADYVSSVEEALKLGGGMRPEPLSPEGKFSADFRAGLIDPAAMQNKDSAKEQQIQRTMDAWGVDYRTAQGIADGVLNVSRHPVTQDVIITNLATNEVFRPGMQGQAAPAQSAPPAAESPTRGLSFGDQFQGAPQAFGVGGALRGAVNTVGDTLGLGAAYPVAQEAIRDYRVLSETLIADVSAAYDRPPVFILEAIRELTPKAGSAFEGPKGAQSKLRALGRSLETELKTSQIALQGELSPENRQKVEQRVLGLTVAVDRVQNALDAFSGGEGQNRTSSGVTWSIEE